MILYPLLNVYLYVSVVCCSVFLDLNDSIHWRTCTKVKTNKHYNINKYMKAQFNWVKIMSPCSFHENQINSKQLNSQQLYEMTFNLCRLFPILSFKCNWSFNFWITGYPDEDLWVDVEYMLCWIQINKWLTYHWSYQIDDW